MVKLRQILDDISRAMRQPTISGLEAISQSTMATLKQRRQGGAGGGGDQQQRQSGGSDSRPNSASRVFSFPSWTLPKKTPKKTAQEDSAPSQGTSQHPILTLYDVIEWQDHGRIRISTTYTFRENLFQAF